MCRWVSRRYWASRKVWNQSTVCGDVATRASREHSTAATRRCLVCVECRWLCAGAASSPASPSATSGTTLRCCADSPSTSPRSANSWLSFSGSASVRAAKPAVCSSARLPSRTSRRATPNPSAAASATRQHPDNFPTLLSPSPYVRQTRETHEKRIRKKTFYPLYVTAATFPSFCLWVWPINSILLLLLLLLYSNVAYSRDGNCRLERQIAMFYLLFINVVAFFCSKRSIRVRCVTH